MKLDLHTHTSYSDGDLTVLGNVNKAFELGLDGIAITDHDNIASWAEISENEYPILVIKGVELSTYYKGASVHLLGYYLNDGGSYEELERRLIEIREDRLNRIDKIISLLKPMGIELEREEILREADGAVARPHVAKAILKKYPHLNLTVNDVFDQFIGNDAPAYVPVNDFQTTDAIELLKRNHCIAVIAHPFLVKKIDPRELLDLDIDGVEGIYDYGFEPEKDIIALGEERGLLITGGSDYHGPITRNSIGKAYIEGDRAKEFVKRIHM